MALQAREQLTFAEKRLPVIFAPAQALPAMVAVAYAIYQGPQRITAIAKRANNLAAILKQGLSALGFSFKE